MDSRLNDFQLLLDIYDGPDQIPGIADEQKWAIAQLLRRIVGVVEHNTISTEWPEHLGWAPIDILIDRLESESQHGIDILARADIDEMMSDCRPDQIDQALAEAIDNKAVIQTADGKYQLNCQK
jgi:hypothetical protein